jgi:hypothetical protein
LLLFLFNNIEYANQHNPVDYFPFNSGILVLHPCLLLRFIDPSLRQPLVVSSANRLETDISTRRSR